MIIERVLEQNGDVQTWYLNESAEPARIVMPRAYNSFSVGRWLMENPAHRAALTDAWGNSGGYGAPHYASNFGASSRLEVADDSPQAEVVRAGIRLYQAMEAMDIDACRAAYATFVRTGAMTARDAQYELSVCVDDFEERSVIAQINRRLPAPWKVDTYARVHRDGWYTPPMGSYTKAVLTLWRGKWRQDFNRPYDIEALADFFINRLRTQLKNATGRYRHEYGACTDRFDFREIAWLKEID
jgi:hypothetical protein